MGAGGVFTAGTLVTLAVGVLRAFCGAVYGEIDPPEVLALFVASSVGASCLWLSPSSR
ncbi:conserved hypothetical protein [Ricinus communis]|uniref:Uncharacterized protein n=1 Tax=Ricinus communis TaxID=3988 RepID=B9TL70_RICCO|nr:conserved hypothetical protein [Ricinus communis]